MARLGFYYLKCTQRLVLQSRKKWNLTHINHVLFSQRAVCSELGGHRGNWRRRASDCLSVFRSDTEPSPHRVSVRGPNQTCITPHSNQLRALSGWDITAASQVWSMFWLFLEGWWFGSLRTLCLFFLSKKKKGNIEILNVALGFCFCTRVNVKVGSLLLYTASDPSSWHTIHM